MPWSLRGSLDDLPQLVKEISQRRGMDSDDIPEFREWDFDSACDANDEPLTTQVVYGSRIAVVWTAVTGDAKLRREGDKWARAHADGNAGDPPDVELTVHNHGEWVRRVIRRHCVAYRRLMLYSFHRTSGIYAVPARATLVIAIPAVLFSPRPIIVLIIPLLTSVPFLTYAAHMRAESEPTLIRDIPIAGGWRLCWSNRESAIRHRGSMPVVDGHGGGYFTLARDSTGSTRTIEDALAMMGERHHDVRRELESMAKRPVDADISIMDADISITDPVPVDVQVGLSSLASGVAAGNGLDVDALRGMLRDDVENHDGRLLAAARSLVDVESRLAKGSDGSAAARERVRKRGRA